MTAPYVVVAAREEVLEGDASIDLNAEAREALAEHPEAQFVVSCVQGDEYLMRPATSIADAVALLDAVVDAHGEPVELVASDWLQAELRVAAALMHAEPIGGAQ